MQRKDTHDEGDSTDSLGEAALCVSYSELIHGIHLVSQYAFRVPENTASHIDDSRAMNMDTLGTTLHANGNDIKQLRAAIRHQQTCAI